MEDEALSQTFSGEDFSCVHWQKRRFSGCLFAGCDFSDALLEGCGLVFTGEGRLDSQSLRGKVISGVGRRAARRNVPVVVVAGGVEPDTESICALPELGVRAVFSINRQAVDFSESRHRSRENYQATFENLLRLIGLAERLD